MSSLAIQAVTWDQVRDIVPRKELDKYDMKCLVRASRAAAKIWIGSADEDVIFIVGLIPPTVIADYAYMWLHVTDKLQGHEFLMIRHSQLAVEEALKHYKYVIGHCEPKNAKALKWLKWLGATFGPPERGMIPFLFERQHG